MLVSKEYTNKQRSKLNDFGNRIYYLYPMRLEEEDQDDYKEFEKLKEEKRKLKKDLLEKKKTDADKIEKDTSH